MVCCIWYFVREVPRLGVAPSIIDMDRWDSALVRVAIILLTIHLLKVEIQQVFFHKTWYLFDPYNFLVLGSMILNLVIVVEHSWSNEDDNSEVIEHITAVACVLLWLILMYWMRLFSQTGFYVKLILQTIVDLKYFLLFFGIIICMFASSVVIIDSYYTEEAKIVGNEEYEPLSQSYTSGKITDAFVSQYLLGLGEFDFSTFKKS
jgi:hypothetical protein